MKLCGILNVSADYLLTGYRSEKEISDISEKLRRLPPHRQRLIAELLDCMLDTNP